MNDIHTILECINSESALEELAETTMRLHTNLAKTDNIANRSSIDNVNCGTDSCQGMEEMQTDTFHFLRWLIFARILPLPSCKLEMGNAPALRNNSSMCANTNVECRIKESWNDAIAKYKAQWHAAQERLYKSTKKNMGNASRVYCEFKLETDNNNTVNNCKCEKIEKIGVEKNKFDDSDNTSDDDDDDDDESSVLDCTNLQLQPEEHKHEKAQEVGYHTYNTDNTNNKIVNTAEKGKLENPLQPERNSIYAHEYEVMHIRREIEKDVERLHWDQCPLFASHDTQEEQRETCLQEKKLNTNKNRNIVEKGNTVLHLHGKSSHEELIELLLTYCVFHRRPYRQGMHELMAFIMFAAWSDKKVISNISLMESTLNLQEYGNWLVNFIKWITDSTASLSEKTTQTNKNHVNSVNTSDSVKQHCNDFDDNNTSCRLALIYTLFTHLIDSHDRNNNSINKQELVSEEKEYLKEQEGQHHKINSVWMGLEEWYYAEDDNGRSGVVHSCELVQNVLLKHIDAFFAFQLTHEHEVHSVVYLVRWLRLLFLREFTLVQALSIWDVIFAQASVHLYEKLSVCQNSVNNDDIDIKPTKSFILWFATSMLLTLRQTMMHMEECQVLQTLMKYPRVRHVNYIIALSIQLEKWWSANQHVARMAPFAIETWWPLFTDHGEEGSNSNTSLFVKSLISTELPRVSNIQERLETTCPPKILKNNNSEEDWLEFEEMSLIPFHYHHQHHEKASQWSKRSQHNNNSSSSNSNNNNNNNSWENEFTLQPISDVLRRQGQRATQLLKNVQQLFKS